MQRIFFRALLATTCLLATCVSPLKALAETTRPNIVFLFADDWGWGDLGCHGHRYVKTPNIDRLAREGTDFYRFTVASGVCSPSRASVMTGHYPARYNIDGHFAWVPSNAKRNMPDWLDTNVVTLPRILQSGGYATAHFGKWHLSNNMIPDSPTPAAYGYDTFGAFNCSGEQMPVHEDADHAIDFIEKSHQAGKPFFINLWMHEPHTPFHTVPKYRWRFRDSGLDETDQIYASVLSHADDRVGEVLDALDRLQLAENTLVIFSSDNGPARGGKELELMHDSATGCGYGIAASKGITAGRKGYKAALFEGGINVPFIARWPGKIAAGKIDKTTMISAVDLLPTFCEIAEVTLPPDYRPDGVGQLAALTGDATVGRPSPLFWKMAGRGAPKGKDSYHWVSFATVDHNWKLLTNRDQSISELYDIVVDPLEKNNLADANPGIVAELNTSITQWRSTLPDAPTGNVFSNLRDSKTSEAE